MHNSSILEADYMATNREMDKENSLFIDNVILLCHEKDKLHSCTKKWRDSAWLSRGGATLEKLRENLKTQLIEIKGGTYIQIPKSI